MQRVRVTAAVALLVVTLGSLAGTVGYAWYLRSAAYRRSCAEYLSTALGLPSDIGRIVPRSSRSREFDDVEVWLPGRRGKALSCRQAQVIATPQPDDPDAYELELLGGTCEISTRTWLREDYRRVVESGLRPGFDPGGPRRVRFSGMNLRFERDRFRGSLDGASGFVVFERGESGWATIVCSALNGYIAAQPAVLQARFSPQPGGIRIDELTLTVPSLPLAVLGLADLVGVAVRSGTFRGELAYGETDDVRRLRLSGMCHDVSLAECTAGLATRPWRGSCPEVELTELTLENGQPRRLRFRGVLSGLILGDVLAPWGLEGVGGELLLRVRSADLGPDGIAQLVLSGQCVNLSLAAATQAWGLGSMNGTGRLEIDDLTVAGNHLRSLDAVVRVEEEPGPRWIEGRLVTALLGRVLHRELPPILPERIEYSGLGVRLDVRDELLHLFGTHGPRDKSILTVRLFEQEVPLIQEPEQSFDLTGWFDDLRARLRAHLRRHVAGAP